MEAVASLAEHRAQLIDPECLRGPHLFQGPGEEHRHMSVLDCKCGRGMVLQRAVSPSMHGLDKALLLQLGQRETNGRAGHLHLFTQMAFAGKPVIPPAPQKLLADCVTDLGGNRLPFDWIYHMAGLSSSPKTKRICEWFKKYAMVFILAKRTAGIIPIGRLNCDTYKSMPL